MELVIFALVGGGAGAIAELAELQLFVKKTSGPPWRTRKDIRARRRKEVPELRFYLMQFAARLVVASGGTVLLGVADVVVNNQGAVFAGISASVIFTRAFGIPNLGMNLPELPARSAEETSPPTPIPSPAISDAPGRSEEAAR